MYSRTVLISTSQVPAVILFPAVQQNKSLFPCLYDFGPCEFDFVVNTFAVFGTEAILSASSLASISYRKKEEEKKLLEVS